MNIVQIEPDKKYILLIPGGSLEQVDEIRDGIRNFLDEDDSVMAFIYGENIAIVPADQIVGYKTFNE